MGEEELTGTGVLVINHLIQVRKNSHSVSFQWDLLFVAMRESP